MKLFCWHFVVFLASSLDRPRDSDPTTIHFALFHTSSSLSPRDPRSDRSRLKNTEKNLRNLSVSPVPREGKTSRKESRRVSASFVCHLVLLLARLSPDLSYGGTERSTSLRSPKSHVSERPESILLRFFLDPTALFVSHLPRSFHLSREEILEILEHREEEH